MKHGAFIIWLMLLTPACAARAPGTVDAPVSTEDGGAQDGWFDSSSDGPPCSSDAVPGLKICCGRPGEVVGSNCASWDEIQFNLTHCVKENDNYDGKEQPYGAHCCEGLVALNDFIATDSGTQP